MILGPSTLRRDDDISIVNNDMTQDLQLVTTKVLKDIVDQINNTIAVIKGWLK